MSIIRSLLTPAKMRATAPGSYSIDDYLQWLSNAGFPLLNQTWSPTEERIEGDFPGLVRGAYQANGLVFACLMTRFMLFSQVRFQYQQMRGGRPGDLFGTPELQIIERPEPGRVTADLLTLAMLDADLAGDWFGVRRPGRIKRLRPDWTIVLVGSRNKDTDHPGFDPDAEVVGYGYAPNGLYSSGEVWTFLPNEVAHFFPIPDPLMRFRGMPLPTAALRDIRADGAATTHKGKYFENSATANVAVKFPPGMKLTDAQDLIAVFEQEHAGAMNAYKTMYLLGGMEATTVGANMQQLEFKATQGAGETRVAAALNVHPAIVGLSEGMAGANLNEGNFTATRRLQADKMLRPNWGNFAGSLETIVPPLPGTRLWYDERDVPFLAEDVKDAADVLFVLAQAARQLGDGGWEHDAVIDAVTSGDLRRLAGQHTGLVPVQLLPGTGQPATAFAARRQFFAASGAWEGTEVNHGDLFAVDHPFVARFPSLFEPSAASGAAVKAWSPPKIVISTPRTPQLTAGPDPIVSREQVLAKKAELVEAGLPAGYESLAKALNVSRETIRRRLSPDLPPLSESA